MIIPEHKYTEREISVANILKGLNGYSSFVNVGFHNWEDQRRHWWIKICEANNIDWNIVDVFEPNVTDAINKGCPANKCKLGNVMDIDSLPVTDIFMFWHGPEHCNKEQFTDMIPLLESKYKVLIFGMLYGEEPQGAAYGNPYENHISAWTPDDWTALGYQVIPVMDRTPAHITVWKQVGNQ